MKFNKRDLKKLFTPRTNSNGEDNGQITIIGGSELFHGAIVLPLQVMDANWIPEDAILTPNKKEYKLLFGNLSPEVAAKKYNCIIVLKGHVTSVFNNHEVIEISGGNPGLTKGGTGDTQAGLTVALLAKNDPLLAACAASYIIKATADELQKSKGIYYNADDLSDKIPEVLNNLIK